MYIYINYVMTHTHTHIYICNVMPCMPLRFELGGRLVLSAHLDGAGTCATCSGVSGPQSFARTTEVRERTPR